MRTGTLLRFPKKSHRKSVLIPKKSARLAEFVGIMLGDGGINNPWQAVITVNSIRDRKYADYISKLSRELFGISPVLSVRKERNTLVLRLSSISVVDFLVELGLPRGNKLKAGLKIPDWILKKKSYKIACVRGLVDTDGCLYVHKHTVGGKKYENLGLSFRSHSPELLWQVATIFEENRIIPHITKRERDLCLYRQDAVSRYLTVFGTANERIGSVYKKGRGG